MVLESRGGVVDTATIETKASIERRFWNKVQRCEHGDGCDVCCWEWVASLDRDEYGKFKLGGQTAKAHAVGYALEHGPFLSMRGLCVCHNCDQPRCVNPAHLWLGTKSDNSADMVDKGRTEQRSKLTDVEVAEIKLLLARGEHSQREIAVWYRVSFQLINHINTGKKHGRIPFPTDQTWFRSFG